MNNKLRRALLRKQRKNESCIKYGLSLLHLWLGLSASIVIFIVCLTGSIYAFKTQIEHVIYSEYRNKTLCVSLNVAEALLKFEQEYGTPTQILIPSESNSAIEITSFSKNNKGVYAYFQPGSGVFLGKQTVSLRTFFSIVLECHRWLLIESPGKTIVGVCVLIFIYMLVSGLVMWFPSKRKKLSSSFLIKWKAKFYRVNYDLHKVLGAYAALLLIFITLTGVYVSFHWAKNVIIQSLGGPSIVINDENIGESELSKDISASFNNLFQGLLSEQKYPKKSMPFNDLMTIAQQEQKGNGAVRVLLPIQENGSYTFLKYGTTLWTVSVADKLILNQYGEVVKKELFEDLPLYKQFIFLAKPLHTGEIFGLFTIVIYFLGCLIGCTLPITGFIIWWKKLN